MTDQETEQIPDPHIIVHQAISLDGRIEGFRVDVGRFFLLAQHWAVDVHMVSSSTILAAPSDPDNTEESIQSNSDMVLAVVDSRGALTSWPELIKAPFWGRYLALCSTETSQDYLEKIEGMGIESWQSSDAEIDLPAAIRMLGQRYAARNVLLDSGESLSTRLFELDLVDELSLMVHPVIAGRPEARSFYRSSEDHDALIGNLDLVHMEELPGDILWLRYTIRHESEN